VAAKRRSKSGAQTNRVTARLTAIHMAFHGVASSALIVISDWPSQQQNAKTSGLARRRDLFAQGQETPRRK
jgi:hypothetical protein